MEGQDIKGLMEAYSHIYSEPEVLNEEVEVEEVDMELEEDVEVLDEQGNRRRPSQETINQNRSALANTLLYGNPQGRRNRVTTPRQRRGSGARNRSSSSSRPVANLPADYKQTELKAGAAAEKSRPGAGLPVSGGGNQGSNRPAPRPTSAPASKPAAAAPAKPVVKQTGDKAKDMAAWAKANPKLAAAKAERDRTRGTSASTNPLMKDMPGKRPAPKTLSKTDAGANFGSAVKIGQSMNKKPATTPASKPATTPTSKPAGAPLRKEPLWNSVDIFDIIKGHLLDEGFAETEESAMVIMANMSEEWRQDILEFLGGQKGDGYLGHPRLGIKNPMAKKQTPTKTSSNTGLAGKLGNRASQMDAAMKAARGK